MDFRQKTLAYLKAKKLNHKSPINVCFSSRSSSGAWQIRGEQIAAMRSNWEAINCPTDADICRFDLFCFVKKPDLKLVSKLGKLNKPIVFDIVDSWAQPADGLKYMDIHGARNLFKQAWSNINADGYIFPTHRMQIDLGSLVVNSSTIYHHYRPLLQDNPIRNPVRIVGYEGADYLGKWKDIIERACERRKLKFAFNPPKYTDIDITVLARDGKHGNFLSKSYKSNVKLANAYGSGTPALVHIDEMSAHDTDSGDVLFFSDRDGSFERQLDKLLNDYELRKQIHTNFLNTSRQFRIDRIADQFDAFFQSIVRIKNRDNTNNV